MDVDGIMDEEEDMDGSDQKDENGDLGRFEIEGI